MDLEQHKRDMRSTTASWCATRMDGLRQHAPRKWRAVPGALRGVSGAGPRGVEATQGACQCKS